MKKPFKAEEKREREHRRMSVLQKVVRKQRKIGKVFKGKTLGSFVKRSRLIHNYKIDINY